MQQLDYKANNTFVQVHNDPNKYIFVRGPVGSGKSSGAIWHLFLSAMNQRPNHEGKRKSKYGIIRATYPALKSTVIKSWEDWFGPLIKIVYDSPIRGNVTLPLPDGTDLDMDLVFIALDKEEEVKKLQSLELTAAHINEAAEVAQGVHQMLKSRIDRYPPTREGGAVAPFIICDYNSVDTEHWLYQLETATERPPKHGFYAQPGALLMCESDDPDALTCDVDGNYYKINPEADNIQNLSKDYYVDQIAGADPAWVNVFILNNWGMVRSGRPVYKMYNDSVHCAKSHIEPLKGVPLIIGMDLGLNPAATFCQLSPMGQFLVLDEIATADCSIQEFCADYLWPKIRNEYSKLDFYVVLDPAAVGRSQNDKVAAFEVVRDAGLPFRLAKTNNPMARRESVIDFLRKVDGFLLDPQCQVLRKGFISEYKFEKIRAAQSEMFKEKPEKNFWSHIHDALQYTALEVAAAKGRKKAMKRGDTTYNKPATTAGY